MMVGPIEVRHKGEDVDAGADPVVGLEADQEVVPHTLHESRSTRRAT